MSARIDQIFQLQGAIEAMAARHGRSELRAGMAYASDMRDTYDRAVRARKRQYRALMRLTAALTLIAAGGAQ